MNFGYKIILVALFEINCVSYLGLDNHLLIPS